MYAVRIFAFALAAALVGCPAEDDSDFSRTAADGVLCHEDLDGDGFGYTVPFNDLDGVCSGPGEATNGDDCDDSDPTRHPDAPEIPDDWIDQNCDGVESVSCMPDRDGDGVGGLPLQIEEDGDCDEADLHPTWDFVDCDDTDASVNPGAPEIPDDGVDQDCDGFDAPRCYYDGDEDGFGAGDGQAGPGGTCDHQHLTDVPGDCDDSADWINPDAEEIPDDGWDQDCSGSDAVTCLEDNDGDGWPGGNAVIEEDGACTNGLLPVWMTADCDDTNAAIHPWAIDAPDDGIDQDCSEADSVGCFMDYDGDGWGSAWVNSDACDGPNEVSLGGDCNDLVPEIHPDAPEIVADGIDQNCDGVDVYFCYPDADGDGYGSLVPVPHPGGNCADIGASAFSGDCNDSTPTISPGAWDQQDDGIDQDCNGVDAAGCYYDGDGDGWGWGSLLYEPDGNCNDDPVQSPYDDDCNDANAAVHPGAIDAADDGVDSDCDGVDPISCWTDADGDGYGDGTAVVDPDGSCLDDPGQADNGDDCDDSADWIRPGAAEIPGDAFDSDCDGDPEN